MFNGLRRFSSIVRQAYKADKADKADKQKQRFTYEQDFLPAALEVMEKPASPVGRLTMWWIVSFFVITIVWAFVGKIDVVAVSQGKVATIGQSKTVQVPASGVVKTIAVNNGQVVKAGDTLIELDTTLISADLTRLANQRRSALIVKQKNQWLLDVLAKPEVLFTLSESNHSSEVIKIQTLLATSQLNEYQAIQAAFEQQLNEKTIELSVVRSELSKTQQTLPLLKEQVDGMKKLAKKGLVPRFQYLEYQERLVSRRKELVINRERIQQVSAAIETLKKQKEQQIQEFRKQVVSELSSAIDTIADVDQELKKAEQTNQQQSIKAPVDGIVQQLSVHTIGAVVNAGDPLMVIVPQQRQLQVEVNVLNKDIGFVAVGQLVEIKLEAFPFTKYGIIEGEVLSIDHQAVLDEQLGLIYPARIKMKRSDIMVDEKSIILSPGMAVTAELKTGKRRVIDFILSPLQRYKQESLRER